jgi:hypothetical protein
MDYQEILTQLLTSGVTACFTMLGGVIVFVFGQIAIKFFIDPIQEQSKLINQIATDFTFYQNRVGYG